MSALDYKKWNLIPDKVGLAGISAFGNISDAPQGFEVVHRDGFTNLLFTGETNLTDFIPFEYLDGFSPNLNKRLHIGHFSNLVMAKAFSALGVAKKKIAIYGDTLEGTDYSNQKYDNFGYEPDLEFFASKMKLNEDVLIDGIGDYIGTKVFKIGEDYHVGLRSNGATTYAYQDIALIQELNAPTLYLTGFEQNGHFDFLRKYSTNVNHIGLGLVTANGSKMSSREGNVIFMDELIQEVDSEFNDKRITYNVLSSFILKTNPKTVKNINLAVLKDVSQSLGLYISYATARLANLPIEYTNTTVGLKTQFVYLKAKANLNPSLLFSHLLDLCKEMSSKYGQVKAKDAPEIYLQFYADMKFCIEKLGMYFIEKV